MPQIINNNLVITNNLQKSNGAFIDTLCHLGCEIVKDQMTDLISDVMSLETEKLMKLFNLRHDINLDALEDDMEFFFLLEEHDILGFLASVHIPIKKHIAIDDNGEITSFSYDQGHCYIDYVYAETMNDLIDKIAVLSEQYLQHDKEKQLKNIS